MVIYYHNTSVFIRAPMVIYTYFTPIKRLKHVERFKNNYCIMRTSVLFLRRGDLMELMEKLQILGESAKYDASCAALPGAKGLLAMRRCPASATAGAPTGGVFRF